MRISELAEQVGVPVSTVRYYERIGLLDAPSRAGNGYRTYDAADSSRLLFISRARKLGLSCEDVTELLGVWGGADCSAAQERVLGLIDQKQVEIAARVAELRAFARQLDDVRADLEQSPPPATCRTDLSCCVPDRSDELLTIGSSAVRG